MQYDAIQPEDQTTAGTALEGKIREKAQRRLRRDDLEIEAEVRGTLQEVEEALANGNTAYAAQQLRLLHWYLWLDPSRQEVLNGSDALDRSAAIRFRQMHQHRMAGQQPDPFAEAKVLAAVAEAQNYVASVADPTRRAPVRLEPIDEPGASTTVDEPTSIGRVRIASDSTVDIEHRTVEIPHQSCDHVLAVALPRSGKDSTLASIGMNLWREHGYSYVSILDDGRMETPMIAIPADEEVIRQNLDRMGQEPRAFDAEVFVPAMGDLPERLPANFTPFTIGIDSLTPNVILRLAGITKSDANAEQRIKRALEETLEGSGQVTELVSRLQLYANEMEATIEWTEVEEKQGGGTRTQTRTVSYEMSAEKALREAAQRLSHLAGEGFLASPSAATNVDMEAVIADQETAAVLCCNFLPAGQEALKYIIMDLWLRLIYQARDRHPRLPRVCLEIRELKNVAPSKPRDVRYKDAIRTLRQTIFFLTTQGGSRRILILGSTQKLNDVYKPVRSNMATKILLRLGEEEIETLDRAYHFSNEQKRQLSEFQIGMGMVLAGGQAHWPVELRGAPCGLGLGDRNWRDRYGLAWGARVRETEGATWRGDVDEPKWWIDANTGAVRVVDEDRSPNVGEWYLLPEDLPDEWQSGEVPEAAEIDFSVVRDALEARREYPVPSNLRLVPTGYEDRQRTVQMATSEQIQEQSRRDIADRFEVPEAVRSWLERSPELRAKFIEVIEVLDQEDDIRTQIELADQLSLFKESSMRNHWNDSDGLAPVVDTDGKNIVLSPVGRAAVDVDWDALEEALED